LHDHVRRTHRSDALPELAIVLHGGPPVPVTVGGHLAQELLGAMGDSLMLALTQATHVRMADHDSLSACRVSPT
jgi:hypothetical protein